MTFQSITKGGKYIIKNIYIYNILKSVSICISKRRKGVMFYLYVCTMDILYNNIILVYFDRHLKMMPASDTSNYEQSRWCGRNSEGNEFRQWSVSPRISHYGRKRQPPPTSCFFHLNKKTNNQSDAIKYVCFYLNPDWMWYYCMQKKKNICQQFCGFKWDCLFDVFPAKNLAQVIKTQWTSDKKDSV